MVSKCGQLFIVTLVFVNVIIHRCFGVNRTNENSEDNTISNNNEEGLEISNKETLLYTNTTSSSNNIVGYLRDLARKKGDRFSKGESMVDKILPLLIIPFLVSSSMIPAMLLSIKFLLIKSALIGKIAVLLMLISYFRRRVDTGGVYNYYPHDLTKEHYGYQGMEEPGVYVNKRRRRRHMR